MDRPDSQRCSICGVRQPLASFPRDDSRPSGRRGDCNGCRNRSRSERTASARSAALRQRFPDVLSIRDARTLSAAVTDALRDHYAGRPGRLIPDLLALLSDADAETRINAHLVALACKALGEQPLPFEPDDLIDYLAALPDSEAIALFSAWQRIADRRKGDPRYIDGAGI